jgi:hypothetical protein
MKYEKLRPQALGILVGYALQFLAGMTLNLFVTIPKKHPGASGSNYFIRSLHSLIWTLSGSGDWQLAFHVYLGLLHDKRWSIVGGIAALLTIGAFFNGVSFIDFNKDISSLIMATCWLGAVTAIIVGPIGYTLKPHKA